LVSATVVPGSARALTFGHRASDVTSGQVTVTPWATWTARAARPGWRLPEHPAIVAATRARRATPPTAADSAMTSYPADACPIFPRRRGRSLSPGLGTPGRPEG